MQKQLITRDSSTLETGGELKQYQTDITLLTHVHFGQYFLSLPFSFISNLFNPNRGQLTQFYKCCWISTAPLCHTFT